MQLVSFSRWIVANCVRQGIPELIPDLYQKLLWISFWYFSKSFLHGLYEPRLKGQQNSLCDWLIGGYMEELLVLQQLHHAYIHPTGLNSLIICFWVCCGIPVFENRQKTAITHICNSMLSKRKLLSKLKNINNRKIIPEKKL